MNNFLKMAYSIERVSEQTICYDTTSYDFSAVYEYKESYAEFSYECQCESERWN